MNSDAVKGQLKAGLLHASPRRPLPVIVLADVSGSMEGEKIAALNESMRQLAESLHDLDDSRSEPWVGVVTFASEATLVLPPVPVSRASLSPMGAEGATEMGQAFRIVREVLEDRARLPGNAYTPTLVLLSDGRPEETAAGSWRRELDQLLASDRAKRGLRLAMAIGADADLEVLRAFVGNPEVPVLRVGEARRIASLFRYVTFTVARRSTSRDPNHISKALLPPPQSVELDDEDLIY